MNTRTRIGFAASLILGLAAALLFLQRQPKADAPVSTEPPTDPVAIRSSEEIPAAAGGSVTNAGSSTPGTAPMSTGPGRVFGKATVAEGADAPSIVVDLHRVDILRPVVSYEDTFVASVMVSAGDEYSFDRLPIGNYQIYASTDTLTGQSSVRIGRSDFEQRADLRLFPGGSISGRVVNADHGAIAGANIFVGAYDIGGARRDAPRERALSSRVVTDADGRFTMGHLRLSSNGEPGYKLGVMAEGYAPLLSDYIPAGTMDAELVLGKGAALSGRLVLSGTADPLPDETVLLDAKQIFAAQASTTDAEGFFFISGVSAGTHLAQLVESEYAIIPENGLFGIAAEAEAAEVTLEAIAGGAVSGRVYDVDTDQGIGGVEVGLLINGEYGGDHATTDGEGRYRFVGLAPRPAEVHLEKPEGYAFSGARVLSPDVTPISGGEISDIDFPLTRGMSVSGFVVDEDDQPVADAWAGVIGEDGWYSDRTRTDGGGGFSVSGFPKGTVVRVYAEKEGYALEPGHWSKSPKYTLEANLSGVKITLIRASRVSGTVVDAGGQPVAGVDLAVQTMAEPAVFVGESSSGGDGSIVFKNIPPGEYAIGARDAWRGGISDESSVVRVAVSPGKDLSGLRFVVSQEPTLDISGRVLDPLGKPVSRASVGVSGIDHDYSPSARYTRTDTDGGFVLSGLVAGTHNVWADVDGFERSGRVRVQAGDKGIVLHVKNFARIEGRVVNDSTGAPVPLFSIGDKRFQDPEGRFVLEEVRAEERVFRVSAEGYAPAAVLAPRVAAGETYRGFVVRLKAGAKLTGRVTDSEGQPVRGVSVELYPGDLTRYVGNPASTESAADGTYQLQSLPAGAQTLRAYHREYAVVTRGVTIAAGVENREDIVLDSGLVLAGIVTLNGQPAPEANVSIRYPDSSGGGTDADSQGRYRIEHLNPGVGRLGASSRGDGKTHHAYSDVSIEAGRINEENIELGAGTASVEGTLYRQPGVPLNSRVHVRVRWEPDGFAWVRSDGRGEFLVEHLPAGRVYVTADGGSRAERTVGVDLVSGQRTRQDIVLSDGVRLTAAVDGLVDDGSRYAYAVLCAGSISFREFTDEIMNHPLRVGIGRLEDEHFDFPSLEPGMYTVVVWEDDQIAFQLGNPDFRRWTSAIVEVTEEAEQVLRLGL